MLTAKILGISKILYDENYFWNIIPEIPQGISESARDFLMNCFEREPIVRLSAKQLLKHKFLKKIGN